jgi:hypothetical protein
VYSFLKCVRCKWVDYLEDCPDRCPVCGSRVELGEGSFTNESVSCPIMDYRGKKKKVTVTFNMVEDLFDKIMGKDAEDLFPDEGNRIRVVFMMKAYLWTLLKTFPNMWAKMGVPIHGLKQVMTLRIQDLELPKDIKELNKKQQNPKEP